MYPGGGRIVCIQESLLSLGEVLPKGHEGRNRR